MPEPNPYIEIFKAIAPVGSWALVIAGWYIVRRDNDNREKRHERRSLLDAVIDGVKSIEQKAYDYYLLAPADDSILQQVVIKRDQSAIEASVLRLQNATGRFSSQEKLSKLRMEITGGQFEQKDRKKLEANDRKLLEISASVQGVIEYLEAEYDNLYPNEAKRKP